MAAVYMEVSSINFMKSFILNKGDETNLSIQ